MQNIILDNISLILLLPLWIFLIIMCGRFFSVYVNKSIIYFLTLLSSLLGAGVCGLALVNIKEPIDFIYPFIKINEFYIHFGLRIDKLSLIMALLLFVISFAVQFFSISYMENEKKNYRFFALLNLFNFSMAFLLFSPNLFQFYVFWELIGVVSYLLIGFDYKNFVKSDASKRVFLMNRFGDTAFISGILIVSYYMFSYVENYSLVTLSFEDFNAISTLLLAHSFTPAFCLICGLFILAAAVKSAQFPFYTWLQDAMEAKAPVSALLHSATMVAAGVYLVIRMMPFFTLSPILTDFVLVLGLITAILCSILGSIETQPKKVLAYSTSANLGIMFMSLGVLNIKACVMFLAAHAFIKSALFLLLPKEENMPKINFILFSIFGLSLAGLLLAGVGVKEFVFKSLEYNRILNYAYIIICFVAGFYITRLAVLIHKRYNLKDEVTKIELASFLILLAGNISLYVVFSGSYNLAEPYAASLGGLAFALLLAKKNVLEYFSQTPRFLERFYANIVPKIYKNIAQGLDYVDNKVLSNSKLVLYPAKFLVKAVNWIEINIMDKSVSLISGMSKELSKRDMILQSGNVQTYNAYAFIILTIIIALVITAYTLLLGLG